MSRTLNGRFALVAALTMFALASVAELLPAALAQTHV
jgi:hypothetical protein